MKKTARIEKTIRYIDLCNEEDTLLKSYQSFYPAIPTAIEDALKYVREQRRKIGQALDGRLP